MVWNGFHVYDGTEIINTNRTEVLAALDSAAWFIPSVDSDFMSQYDTGSDYADVTTAPWYDPDIPASTRFYGIYPLEVSGFNNSSRASNTVEGTRDGGTPGRVRYAVKSVVYSAMALGHDTEAVQYGLDWLSRALLGRECGDTTRIRSYGFTLDYLDADPVINVNNGEGPEGAYQRLERHLHRVTFNTGPAVTSEHTLSTCDGAFTSITFTATVGDPFEYGRERLVVAYQSEDFVIGPGIDMPGGASEVVNYGEYEDTECGEILYQPLFDPACPPLIAPPTPPSVPLSCYVMPTTWERYILTIPQSVVHRWVQAIPKVIVTETTGDTHRGVRIRIYPDPDGEFDVDYDPCDFVADFVITYLPPNSSFTIDGVTETVDVVLANGTVRRGDSLVIGTDGKPFKWPSLSCDQQYILAMDLDPSPAQTVPDVDVHLTDRFV